jgi:hypothetical protein
MTSLAVAHTTTANFNADFYATGAAVIATLFVALAVQHGAMEEMLNTTLATSYRTARNPNNPRTRLTPSALVVVVLAWGILTLAVAGEGLAVGALSYHRDTRTDRFIVITAVSALLAIVAIVPAIQIGRATGIIKPASPKPGDGQPEPGKTDPA